MTPQFPLSSLSANQPPPASMASPALNGPNAAAPNMNMAGSGPPMGNRPPYMAGQNNAGPMGMPHNNNNGFPQHPGGNAAVARFAPPQQQQQHLQQQLLPAPGGFAPAASRPNVSMATAPPPVS